MRVLYIERWLKAPVEHPDGSTEQRDRGTPQGGVISPLLANLFLHYVFDAWVTRHWGGIQFERYADDIVCHCASEHEANALRRLLTHRFNACGLKLHPEKTKVVYCMGGYHRERHLSTTFNFLGYTFKPTWIRTRKGEQSVHFIASISQKSAKHIRDEIKRWPWSYWVQKELSDIRRYSCSRLAGWLEYFGLFGRSVIREVLYYFDRRLARWAKRKYKKLKTLPQAIRRVNYCRDRNPYGFPHWRAV